MRSPHARLTRNAALAATGFFALLTLAPRASIRSGEADVIVDPMGYARTLDPLGDSGQRRPVPGGFRTRFGFQLHPHCFRIAERNGSIPRADVEARVNRWLESTLRKLLEGCGRSYPELNPYILQWIASARRTVVSCLSQDGPTLGFGAVNLRGAWSLYFPSERAAVAGLIDDMSLLDSLHSLKRPVVLLPSDTWNAILRKFAPSPSIFEAYSPFPEDTLLHEIFHSTTANNRDDHNMIEQRMFDLAQSCSESVADDRINVISNLCSGASYSITADLTPVWKVIAGRVSQCGADRGCLSLFRGRMGFWASLGIDSEGLETSQARSICRKLVRRGNCDHWRDTQGATITRANPALRAIGERLAARLDPILPRATNDLPVGLLGLHPGERRGFESLQATDCFKSVFTRGPDGTLFVRGPEAGRHLPEWSDRFDLATYERRFEWARTRALESPGCGDTSVREALLANLSRIRDEGHRFLRMDLVVEIALHRVQGQAEPFVPVFFSFQREDLAHWLGRDLLEDYLGALRRFHHKSPDFDCEASGLPLGEI